MVPSPATSSRGPAPRRTWVAALAVAACVAHRACSAVDKKHSVRTTAPAWVSPISDVYGPRSLRERQSADGWRRGRSGVVARRAQAKPERQPASDQGERRGRKTALQAQAQTIYQQTDATYNPAWLDMEEKPIESLDWEHDQTGWAAAASGIFIFDLLRILALVPPTAVEAVAVGLIYFGLYASRYQEVPKLESHYQVSFYASCGWTFYAWASLVHGMAYGPSPILSVELAEPLHVAACGIYLMSCLYFYAYHWGRQIKHIAEGRFRPWFAAGLASLTAVHGLTVGHIWKCLDDPGWFGTVAKIYQGEWQWLADTRLLELYLTAAALFLVILHLRGVLTGTKNAALVFLGTVILPTAALMFETFSIDACAWQHYFMTGPKYW